MRTTILSALLLFIFMSCGNKVENNSDAAQSEAKSETKADAPDAKGDETTWKGFWMLFQAAVAAGDKAKIKALTDFSALDEKSFEDTYEIYFTGEGKEKIAKAKASDAEKTEQVFEGLDKPEDIRMLNFSEKGSDEEGNEYESAIMYYFAKVNGKYRLVYLVAAG